MKAFPEKLSNGEIVVIDDLGSGQAKDKGYGFNY